MKAFSRRAFLAAAIVISLVGNGHSRAAAPAVRAAEARGYVGSQKCRACHPDKYSEWKGTLHSRMVQEFNPGSTDANFEIAPFNKGEVRFVIGGMDEYDFVGRRDLKLIPFYWDMGKREWVKQDVYNWIGECAQCHTTGWEAKSRTWSEIAIACEACHGPGRAHVASGGKTKVIRSVGSDEMCGRCHNGTEKEPRQGVRIAVNHGKSLADLRADREARGECLRCHSQDYREAPSESSPTLETAKYGITCVTCHDPHKRTGHPGQLKEETNKLCTDCHTAVKVEVGSGARVRQPQKEMIEGSMGIGLENGIVNSVGIRLEAVPNSAIKKKVTCSDCHMKYDVPRSAGTMPNHLFKAGTPSGSYRNHFGETVPYNSCTGCHASMSQERFDAYQKEVRDRVTAIQKKLDLAKSYQAQARPADRGLYEHAFTILSFVRADGSFGIHNDRYTKDLLRAADVYITDFLNGVPDYAK